MTAVFLRRAWCVALPLALLYAPAALAVCDTANPNNPENDCDEDGYTLIQGDCDDRGTACAVDACDPVGGPYVNKCVCGKRRGWLSHPNAPEVCDGEDNNCNTQVDDGLIVDADQDGVRACNTCGAPTSCDCDDTRANVKPGQAEVCDGLDNNCNGSVDESLVRACYSGPSGTKDVGLCKAGSQSCNASTPGVESWGTCIGQVLPSTETCNGKDDDCNGTVDNGLVVDADSDGVRACGTCGAPDAGSCDCDDTRGSVRPGQPEVCDALDNNCNGLTDERNGAGDKLTRLCFSGPAGTYTGTCPGPSCDPRGTCEAGSQLCNASTPGTASWDVCQGETLPAAEVCDGLDNDCDGTSDDGLVVDADGDGARACNTCGAGTNCDCDDSDAQRKPGRTEVCDGKDNDCDNVVDDGVPTEVCFSGPAGTYTGTCPGPNCAPRGVCRAGARVCTDGTYTGVCNGEVLPGVEVCNGKDDDCDGLVDEGFDNDHDGVTVCQGDCDDNDPTRRPGATEVCDGKDNNCNGTVDENFDNDGDGFTTCAGDCNDNDPATFPGAPEDCACADRNCDGRPADGFPDSDGDGVPNCAGPTVECNDGSSRQHGAWCGVPAVVETCDALDNDCDGLTDERNSAGDKIQRTCYSGPAGTVGVGICKAGTTVCNATIPGQESFSACQNETPPANPPAQGETACNGVDDDCDGTRDDGFDQDGDGFVACSLCASASPCDCNDNDPTIKPGAVETCDAVDQNCNGRLDDVPARLCFSGEFVTPDTYEGTCPGPTCAPQGACQAGQQTCQPQGVWSACNGQVLPTNPSSQPEAVCNGKDDDCDGEVDDGDFDLDKDGFRVCAGDCRDDDAAINPAAIETCDNVDNNCDGVVDGVSTACYPGPQGTVNVGVCKAGTSACTNGVPTGTCTGAVVPTAETCNGLDDDCDGKVDEDFDVDGDGAFACSACQAKYGADCDCDDTNAFNRPGLAERCDCQDNNCNGQVDEGKVPGTNTMAQGAVCIARPCYDFDGDGYTNCERDCDDNDALIGPHRSEKAGNGRDDDCDGQVDEDTDEDGDGYSVAQGDCDDRYAAVHPGAVEVCDGFDNNCDNRVDEGFDLDGDFATVCAGDCDDTNRLVSPFAREVCGNGKDDNCNGLVDEDADADEDGVTTCQGDCNDYHAGVFPAVGDSPAATEVCDGQDNDCDGTVDEGFDQDGDRITTCLGDCDDTNPSVNSRTWETPGNGIDDNCNGQVDEGMVDVDGDGFSPMCGDCNDADPSVHPHAREVCDRIDNTCDSYVDSEPGRFDLCATCFDADGDGVTNCAGDCNDADARIFRGAPEVCDGVDNDCEGSVDLDAQGLKVCREGSDGGVEDGGSGAVDAGSGEDGGQTTTPGDGGTGGRPTPVTVGCGCNGASPGTAGTALLALLALLRRRRRPSGPAAARARWQKGAVPLVCLLLLALPLLGCESRVTAHLADAGEPSDAGAAQDGGTPDGGDFVPPVDWKCGALVPQPVEVAMVPGTRLPFAIPHPFTRTELTANGEAVGLLLDDAAADLYAFVLRRPLPSDIPADDARLAETVGVRELAALSALGGTPLVEERTERFRRLFVGNTFFSSEVLTLGAPSTAFSMRGRLAGHLSGRAPGELSLPQESTVGTRDTRHVLNVMTRVVGSQLLVVGAVSPASRLEANRALLMDLTNGSHLGAPDAILTPVCEEQEVPRLASDFIFVVDNSASMLEEQQALADAAASLYAAFAQSGLDFRVGVVTTDGDVLRGEGFTRDLSAFQSALRVGINGNGVEMGLEYGLRAIQRARSEPRESHRLREDAAVVLVFFSDEEATGLHTTAEYAQSYLAEGAVAFAIVGPRPTGCQRVGLGQARAGTAYIDVASATGGTSGSICNPNLSETVNEVLIGALGAASSSRLGYRPISASLSLETGSPAPRSRVNGFDYDPVTNAVLLFGEHTHDSARFRTAYSAFVYLE